MILCIGTTPACQRVMTFNRVVPDAVNRAVNTHDGVAGKSVNVAKVLQALGEPVVATGFLGGDRGREVEQALTGRGITVDFVAVQSRTRQCITLLDQSTSAVTELVEESKPVPVDAYEDLIKKIEHYAPSCRAMVMSGTITPGGPTDFYRRCTHLAHTAKAIPVVDAQGLVLLQALEARPGVVKPNRTELAATVNRALSDDSSVIDAMRELNTRGAQRVVVTAGQAAVLAFDGQSVWRVDSPSIQAVNPIGSGDAFTAGLVWRLAAGDHLGEACRWGAAAGAANALTLMAGEVDKREVERLVERIVVTRI